MHVWLEWNFAAKYNRAGEFRGTTNQTNHIYTAWNDDPQQTMKEKPLRRIVGRDSCATCKIRKGNLMLRREVKHSSKKCWGGLPVNRWQPPRMSFKMFGTCNCWLMQRHANWRTCELIASKFWRWQLYGALTHTFLKRGIPSTAWSSGRRFGNQLDEDVKQSLEHCQVPRAAPGWGSWTHNWVATTCE